MSAAFDRAGLHARAGLVLRDPAGIDDVGEIVLRDRVGRQQDRVHLDVTLALVELDDARQILDRRAVRQQDRKLGGLLAEIAASFQIETVWVPSAMRLIAAWSPSWPETGTEPAMPCAASAATTPPAMPSFSATTASTLLLFLVRICSMFFCALSGFHPSV